jgi:hypothetical protein
MRRVLPALLLCSTALATPPCEQDGIIVFPAPGAIIPTNVEFILEGTGAEQARVSELVGSDKLNLTQGSDTVALKVERGWISSMRRVAVKLKPSKPLKPNLEYRLSAGKAMPGAHLLNDVFGDGSIRWTSGAGADKTPPKFLNKPGVSGGSYERGKDGGLSRWLTLRTDVEENGPAWVLVTMQRSRGSTSKQVYPVPVDKESVKLGHDACSGAFGYDDGRAYKVNVVLYDSAGNKSTEKVNLELSAPRPTAPP